MLLADTAAPPRAIAAGRSALLAGDATMATLAVDLDLTLRTDRLVPLSRWVTPPGLGRRFDTRFFAASLEDGTEVVLRRRRGGRSRVVPAGRGAG